MKEHFISDSEVQLVILYFLRSVFLWLSMPIAVRKQGSLWGILEAKTIPNFEPPFSFSGNEHLAMASFVMGNYSPIEFAQAFLPLSLIPFSFFLSEYSIINPVAWSFGVEISFTS